MIEALVVSAMTLACLGKGAVLMRILRVAPFLGRAEQWTWAFAIGYGVLGWLLFFVGVSGALNGPVLVAVVGVGLLGLVTFPGNLKAAVAENSSAPWDAWERLLLACVILSLGMDLLEGLSPPADGDSLAYHFALPKQFLEAGRIEFVPRAFDGAVPLLIQSTYMPALGLGGERALTLWTMVLGWAGGGLVYGLMRRFLNRRWALAGCLLVLTTPAILYGAGSGQVEVRMALFAGVAAFSVAEARRGGLVRFAVLGGLAAGFTAASKFTGPIFVLACGLAILFHRRWLMQGLAFAGAALVAGGQWYFWNWLHTGDPVFPLLFNWLGPEGYPYWDAAHQALVKDTLFKAEQVMRVDLLHLFAYPFVATFAGQGVLEAGRTGLGPLGVLALPFAAAAAWRFRSSLRRSSLWPVAAILAIFYLVWFMTGSSQRVRHLVPLYPLLVIVVLTAAEHWARASRMLRPLSGLVALVLLLQLAGQAVFSVSFARHVFSGESRQAFLHRSVTHHDVVPWINANLSKQDRVLVWQRWLNYLFEAPYFYAHFATEVQVDVNPEADDPLRLLAQLRSQGITHLLSPHRKDETPATAPPAKGLFLWRALEKMGCLERVAEVDTQGMGSRTLPHLVHAPTVTVVLKVRSDACPPALSPEGELVRSPSENPAPEAIDSPR